MMNGELRRQLEAAKSDNEEVQAVVSLQPPAAAQRFLTPDQTVELTQRLLRQVEQETGQAPTDFNIFENLGSFVVSASPEFIERMLQHDEVATAVPNRPSGRPRR
jgi:chaperonin cofactor prefoldin